MRRRRSPPVSPLPSRGPRTGPTEQGVPVRTYAARAAQRENPNAPLSGRAWVQPTLRVGQPDGQCEREADRVAERATQAKSGFRRQNAEGRTRGTESGLTGFPQDCIKIQAE